MVSGVDDGGKRGAPDHRPSWPGPGLTGLPSRLSIHSTITTPNQSTVASDSSWSIGEGVRRGAAVASVGGSVDFVVWLLMLEVGWEGLMGRFDENWERSGDPRARDPDRTKL